MLLLLLLFVDETTSQVDTTYSFDEYAAMVRVLYSIFFILTSCHGKLFEQCRFVQRFYGSHPTIFQLNEDQTSLTVRPLYALSNQSFSSVNQSLDLGIIYRFAETYLVPIPLVFQCAQSEQIFVPKDCEFTLTDRRVGQQHQRMQLTVLCK